MITPDPLAASSTPSPSQIDAADSPQASLLRQLSATFRYPIRDADDLGAVLRENSELLANSASFNVWQLLPEYYFPIVSAHDLLVKLADIEARAEAKQVSALQLGIAELDACSIERARALTQRPPGIGPRPTLSDAELHALRHMKAQVAVGGQADDHHA